MLGCGWVREGSDIPGKGVVLNRVRTKLLTPFIFAPCTSSAYMYWSSGRIEIVHTTLRGRDVGRQAASPPSSGRPRTLVGWMHPSLLGCCAPPPAHVPQESPLTLPAREPTDPEPATDTSIKISLSCQSVDVGCTSTVRSDRSISHFSSTLVRTVCKIVQQVGTYRCAERSHVRMHDG